MKSTKRIKPTKKTDVPIALDSPIVAEKLPLPFVHYPNHYGVFLGFSDQLDGELYFCKCSESAIKNLFGTFSFEVPAK
jgi:hypothetical protein